jgi:ArsR family metal-binding transcriptional regulator
MVLRGYRITHISPCLADPDKIRAVVELDEEIREAFPYINSLLKSCTYDHPDGILSLKKDGKMITLYPRKVTVAKAANKNDVRETMEWLKKLTGELFIKKGEIKPDYNSGVKLEAPDIYELLPGINCKVCNELTCLAFAEKLLSKERNIVRCAPLFTPEYKEKRQVLGELLRAAGYAVPGTRE